MIEILILIAIVVTNTLLGRIIVLLKRMINDPELEVKPVDITKPH